MNWRDAATRMKEIAGAWDGQGGPGGAIVAFDAEGVREEAYGGLADIEHGLPCAPDTAFRYASLSKHVMAALLIRSGAMRLDDRLGDHGVLPSALADVPVGRALDMTGGIPDVMETVWQLGIAPTTVLSRDDLLGFASSLDALNFAPGTEVSYSNTGYRLIQAALEAKGIAYADALRDTFFAPLGLDIRFPFDWSEPIPRLATGYWPSPAGWRRGRYGSYLSASGGLAGTAGELATWLSALLAGEGPAKGLLPALCAPRLLADGRATRYGLGLGQYEIGGETLIGHGGSLPGYKNHILLSRTHGAGVVVLSNREDVDPLPIALSVMARLIGASMPAGAPAHLPTGRFIAREGPFWLDHEDDALVFLGARQSLYGAVDGSARSLAPEYPVRLEGEGDVIEAEIGHVARRFERARPPLAPDRGWVGRWRCDSQHAAFDIEVAAGAARLVVGSGPARSAAPLTAIAPDLSLVERRDGPWSLRICVSFARGEARLLTSRSRMLRFVRS